MTTTCNRALITALTALAAATPLWLAGCALMPYENEFSCSRTDNYGKCLNMNQAYRESVTGESQGSPMIPASKQNGAGHNPPNKKNHKKTPPPDETATAEATDATDATDAYSHYRDASYQALTDLLEQPKTPMLRPPVTVRTLILSYSDRDRKQRLYMPRYVYSILEGPQWVLGPYLDRRDSHGLMPTFQPPAQKNHKGPTP